jgi:hypothetical protein
VAPRPGRAPAAAAAAAAGQTRKSVNLEMKANSSSSFKLRVAHCGPRSAGEAHSLAGAGGDH